MDKLVKQFFKPSNLFALFTTATILERNFRSFFLSIMILSPDIFSSALPAIV